MSIKAGLVGLPNVGKSTLFNALTRSSVPAHNYPFCTIDPHVAITQVPDARLDQLARLYESREIISASVSFVDIAGLVKGAAAGQGLGNQFLSHIREVDLIIHVLRCFVDPNVVHVHQNIDPLEDYGVIMAELMLKDLESVQKRLTKLETLIRGAVNKPAELKELTTEQTLLARVLKALNDGDEQTVRTLVSTSGVQTIPLLAAKNFLIVANVDEQTITQDTLDANIHYQSLVKHFGIERVIGLCIKLEHELSSLVDEEAAEFMQVVGVKQLGINTIIQRTYAELGLITFFTCGPKEAHAWPIRKGMSIRRASGEIHSDLERGFICAEIVNCTDILALKSPAKAKEFGKVRTEGQDYTVQDGDIILVRFNV